MYYSSAVLQAVLLLSSATAILGEGSFSYDPDSADGPASWATLQIPENQCGGDAQSPINIVTSVVCDEKDVDYRFDSGDCTVSDMTFFVNDHVMQGSYNASLCNPPTMTIPNMEDGEFVAAQFHIHLGTEHSIDNTFYGADFHLVHTQVSGGGRYAVLGLELEPSEDGTDGVFHTLVEEWLTYSEGSQEKCDALESRRLKKGHSQRRLEVFDVYGLIPENATEYYYKGSLTTPPCSELVEWNVVDIPVKISQEDFDAITGVLLNYVGENCTKSTVAFNASSSRPINPLNNRTVTHKCPASSRLEAPAPTAGGAPTAPVKSPVKAPTSGSSSATCFLAAAAAAGLVASFCM